MGGDAAPLARSRRPMTWKDSLTAALVTAKITVPTALDSVFRPEGIAERADERLRWWAGEILRQADVTLHVRGEVPVPDDVPLVVMSNHRSYFDIPASFCAIPGRMRMVAKKELFRVPLFGRAMRATGFIEVDRGKREKAVTSLNDSKALLTGGARVWIAPEGTRTKTGKLGPFKSGGFHLALDAGVPILPLAITGTELAMGPESFAVTPGATITVNILPLIDAPSYGKERRKELMAAVRASMLSVLGE